jgi:NTE family protein
VLQGGGALGAYQAGVYQALHEAEIEPNWVAGVSIGAINCAIIAGNARRFRLQRLRTFWERITERRVWSYTPDGDNATSSWLTMTQGQPGFFTPRQPNPWFSLTGAKTATSYYDSALLRETLLELVDFDLINERIMRFSVGATNVLTGNFIYFDNHDEEIGPEHVMASGALPPALPMIKIGTDHFWDGGIVSNTPLQHLLDQEDRQNMLIFQVDLFSARRRASARYPGRDGEAQGHRVLIAARYTTDLYRRLPKWKTRLLHALEKVPKELLSDEERGVYNHLSAMPQITILQLIYQQKAYEGHAKDYEFSGTSMREHWQSGYEDTKRTLKNHQWLRMPEDGTGIVVHDVHREYER